MARSSTWPCFTIQSSCVRATLKLTSSRTLAVATRPPGSRCPCCLGAGQDGSLQSVGRLRSLQPLHSSSSWIGRPHDGHGARVHFYPLIAFPYMPADRDHHDPNEYPPYNKSDDTVLHDLSRSEDAGECAASQYHRVSPDDGTWEHEQAEEPRPQADFPDALPDVVLMRLDGARPFLVHLCCVPGKGAGPSQQIRRRPPGVGLLSPVGRRDTAARRLRPAGARAS